MVYLNDTAELEPVHADAAFSIDNGDTGYARKITGVGADLTWEQLAEVIKLSDDSEGAEISFEDAITGATPTAGAKAISVEVVVTTPYGNTYKYIVQA